MWFATTSNPWNYPNYLYTPIELFSAHSILRAQTWSLFKPGAITGFYWYGFIRLSMGERYCHLAFPCLVWLLIKGKSETKTVCSKEQKSLQSPLPLFRAILIGFCYCTVVTPHFPGVPARGNHRFCGDLTAAVASGPFPRVQPKQKPSVDQPLWWPDSHRRVRATGRTASVVTWEPSSRQGQLVWS